MIMVKTNGTNIYVGKMLVLQDVIEDSGRFDLIFTIVIMTGLINLSLCLYAAKSIRGPTDIQLGVAEHVRTENGLEPNLKMLNDPVDLNNPIILDETEC